MLQFLSGKWHILLPRDTYLTFILLQAPQGSHHSTKLSEFKNHLDDTLSLWFNFRGSCKDQRVGLHDPYRCLPTWGILWFHGYFLTEDSCLRHWEGLVWTSAMLLRNWAFKSFTSILKLNLSNWGVNIFKMRDSFTLRLNKLLRFSTFLCLERLTHVSVTFKKYWIFSFASITVILSA